MIHGLAAVLLTLAAQEEGPTSSGPRLRIACLAAPLLRELTENSVTLCAEALHQASLLGGQGERLVTTGTLQQAGEVFTYSASPRDRLRVEFANGRVTEFTVSKVEGDTSGDVRQFLRNDHEFRFRIASAGAADVELSAQRQNGRLQASLEGSFVFEEATYRCKMSAQGTYSFSGESGFVNDVEERITEGTLSAAGFSLRMKETYSYEGIYNAGDSVLVQNMIETTQNDWTEGDRRYALEAKARKAFKNLKPSEIDSYWHVSGTLLRDGVKVGRVEGGKDGGKLKTWLVLSEDRIELQSWELR